MFRSNGLDPRFFFGLGATVFFAAALAVVALLSRTSRATMRRLEELTRIGTSAGRGERFAAKARKQIFALLRWLRAKAGLPTDVTLPERLARAGYKGIAPADVYSAARILCPLVALAIGSAIPFHRVFWMISLPGIAYLTPDLVLNQLIRRRRETIRRSIPDAVDLLVICVDAGLGIDQALLRVGQELGTSHPDITEELLQINREQRAGRPRTEAWFDMSQRCDLPDIHAFANMLLQTERFGSPVARALSSFAHTIRQKRRQVAEEMAAKTTIKIIFPLVLFIFPSMFMVLLGPAALNIIRGMSSMSR